MNKYGQRRLNPIQAIVALILGFVIVVSIPEAKAYLDMLFNAILTAVFLGVAVAVIILIVWYFWNRYNE